MEHLSDIELYFTSAELISRDELIITGDEFHHSINVMRNSVDDILFVTNGEGSIFKVKIFEVYKNELTARVLETKIFENKLKNIWFCIPALKNPDRLKFAFEKCVELGITNFILFSSKYTITKTVNADKFKKTALAAMKQSLRSYLPKIVSSSFSDIIKIKGKKYLFNQHSLNQFIGDIDLEKACYFLFGPEGGFDNDEIESIDNENRFCLSAHRLRSETAIVKCASLIKFP